MGVDDSPISLRTRKVTVMPYPSNLELSVTNFGPVARADIDLRPMTVFVGPSNTGKSYLAILIYALHNFFGGHSAEDFLVPWRYARKVDSSDTESMSDALLLKLSDWTERLVYQVESSKRPSDVRVQFPESIRPMVHRFMETVNEAANLLNGEVARCFGVENTGGLIRHGTRAGARVNLKRAVLDSYPQASCAYEFAVKKTGSDFAVSIPDETPMYAERIDTEVLRRLRGVAGYSRIFLDEHPDFDESSRVASGLFSELVGLVEQSILNPLNRVAHYLPADRTGVMHAHRVAVGSLIERTPYAGIQRDDPLPLLSGVLADFLRRLLVLGEQTAYITPSVSIRPTRSKRIDGDMLAGRLEEEVLRGSVHNRITATGYPVFSYQPDGWEDELPLMNASSMVSELAPVVLYLRHVVSPGEVLIIEEPESHLHPAMQVEFIRHLAAAVRSGVRVMITTHSEWVLDELANLVRLSDLPETRRKGIGGADYSISPEQLGVWLFEPKQRPRGSVVKEIPFDEKFGGFRSGFDEVAIGTYNDYAAISNRVEQGRSE